MAEVQTGSVYAYEQPLTCMGKVGKDVALARLAVGWHGHYAPCPEVAPPRIPDPVVQERLPPLRSTLSSSHMFAGSAELPDLDDSIILSCSLWSLFRPRSS